MNTRDIDLIETALQSRKKDLSMTRLSLLADTVPSVETSERLAVLKDTLADIHRLLGLLHNQKMFFRPGAKAQAPYVSG